MSCMMLRINRQLKLISRDAQLTPPSLLVRKYFWIQRICQSHMPMSTPRDANKYTATLANMISYEYSEMPLN